MTRIPHPLVVRGGVLPVLIPVLLVLLSALIPRLLGATAESDLEFVHSLMESTRSLTLAERIEKTSERLLGKPYELGGLGEGPGALYDQDPLYRFDSFDCTTFVETVIALSRADDFPGFEREMNRVRYVNGKIGFTTRNHFTSLDWIPNNATTGILRDVTVEVAGEKNWMDAVARIDPGSWYKMMKESDLNVRALDKATLDERLLQLRNEAKNFEAHTVHLPYIPVPMVLGPSGKEILDRIPDGAMINIVRPGWDLTEVAGTQLNISHQGLAIRVDGILNFRHASSAGSKMVTQQPLDEYLSRFRDHATIKGINVLQVLEPLRAPGVSNPAH